MTAFWISFGVAAFEMFLIFMATAAIANKKRMLMAFMLLILFITFIVAIWFLVFKYFSFIIWCICGFTIGLPFSAIAFYIIRMIKSK